MYPLSAVSPACPLCRLSGVPSAVFPACLFSV
nr:MAG TPA: hypothetical protein [Caudoviricetes sp.]DAX83585.1 MAG TPA: hypothetical protein [Caudoviricetes sp.]